MAGNTKVLVIGATGYIGQHIAKAAASEPGVTAFALVSKATGERATAERVAAVEKLRSTPGLNVLEVDYTDHAALVDIFKQVTVVISTVGFPLILDQIKFLEAAKEAGTITRFLPSEFGLEPSEKTEHALGQHPLLANKKKVSEAARKLGIPYTLVYANSFAGYFAGNLGQLSPLENDEVDLFGTGDVKAIIVDEADIGRYTVKAALDPRTANKIVRLEPPRNVLTQNELVALAEKVWGKSIKKKQVSAEALVEAYNNGEEAAKTLTYLRYAVWVAGDQTQPKQADHLSSADLYPDVEYKPIEAILKQ